MFACLRSFLRLRTSGVRTCDLVLLCSSCVDISCSMSRGSSVRVTISAMVLSWSLQLLPSSTLTTPGDAIWSSLCWVPLPISRTSFIILSTSFARHASSSSIFFSMLSISILTTMSSCFTIPAWPHRIYFNSSRLCSLMSTFRTSWRWSMLCLIFYFRFW